MSFAKVMAGGGEQAKKIQSVIDSWEGFKEVNLNKLFKRINYKISIKKLFKTGEYQKLGRYEKRRIKKISKHLTVMWWLDLPLPTETSLRAKVGLPPRGGLKVLPPKGIESDHEWKPGKSMKKKVFNTHARSQRDLEKRKIWIEKHLMVDKKGGKVSFDCKKPGCSRRLVKCKPRRKCKKNKGKKSVAQKTRFSTRNVKRVIYKEEEEVKDDAFLFCDDCDVLHLGECPFHGELKRMEDTRVKIGLKERARRTCPDGIYIAESCIRFGGNGAWTKIAIPKNTTFGPYEGEIIPTYDIRRLNHVFQGGYSWEVYDNDNIAHYLDGMDVRKSNWLRYINCARKRGGGRGTSATQIMLNRNEEEQTMVAYQYKGEIYYKTYKDVKPGMELLVWYGDQYAGHLGIPTSFDVKEKSNMGDTKLIINPKVLERDDVFHCKVCDRLFSDPQVLATHIKSRHGGFSIKKKFACQFCDYSTDHRGNLKYHLLRHSNEKPHKCETCGKSFGRKSNLQRHIRSVHEKQQFSCEVCEKKFNVKGNLRKHVRTVHEKRKDFVCTQCGEAFGFGGTLKTHIRSQHTNEKPFCCTFCSKSFSKSSNLSSHIITNHTKQYPHVCTVCHKGFRAPSELRKHAEKNH